MFAFDFIVDDYQKFVLFFVMWNIYKTILHAYYEAKSNMLQATVYHKGKASQNYQVL